MRKHIGTVLANLVAILHLAICACLLLTGHTAIACIVSAVVIILSTIYFVKINGGNAAILTVSNWAYGLAVFAVGFCSLSFVALGSQACAILFGAIALVGIVADVLTTNGVIEGRL